jgi:hypothetical protein
LRILTGASKYHNLRKIKGNDKIPCIGSIFSLETLGPNCNLKNCYLWFFFRHFPKIIKTLP